MLFYFTYFLNKYSNIHLELQELQKPENVIFCFSEDL